MTERPIVRRLAVAQNYKIIGKVQKLHCQKTFCNSINVSSDGTSYIVPIITSTGGRIYKIPIGVVPYICNRVHILTEALSSLKLMHPIEV